MDGRADSELLPVSDPEVDLAALTAEVHAAAARLRSAEETAALRATPGAAHSAMGWLGAAGPWRSPVDATATILPYADLDGGGGAVARARVALQRAVRRALRWYLWPVVEQASAHNRAVSAVLAENRRQLTVLRLESERVRRELELAGAAPGGTAKP
jgi:hypothetical protein